MSKLLIVVHSKGGSTRRYAELLAKNTDGTVVSDREATDAMITQADTVVFASWVMAGTLSGGFLKKHWQALKGRKVALMVVGLSPCLDEKAWQRYAASSLTPEMQASLRVFYLRGAYHPEERGWFTRMAMNMVASRLAKKPDLTQGEKEMVDGIRHGCDFVKAEFLADLETYVR